MSKNKPTTDEHYIPQFYLRNFSPDGEHIYQYDVLSGKQTQVAVPIRSVCYEKDLYEFKDNSGEFVKRNLIERCLGIYEAEFANIFRSIQSKVNHFENYNTRCFLSKQEKEYIVLFLSTLIVRHPDIIQEYQDRAIKLSEGNINKNSARNMALEMCIPLYKRLTAKDANLLGKVMGDFYEMSFMVGITDTNIIITSDFPAVVIKNNLKVDAVILPLSSNLVLYKYPYDKTPRQNYNCLFTLTQNDIEYINKVVARCCRRWIYSKSPLTEKQIEIISIGRSNL